ncbi:hypothetical protein D3C78_1586760 [compost metagenome]
MGNALGVHPFVDLTGHAHRAQANQQAGRQEDHSHAVSLSWVAQLKLTQLPFKGFFLRSHALTSNKAHRRLDLKEAKQKNPKSAVEGLPEADPLGRS